FFIDSEEPPESALDAIGLSEIDLLENACSLAEFQVSTAGCGDAKTFLRWSKRHPSYVEAIKFVGKSLNDNELALRCFLSLVRAAFHTSRPVRAFHLLICTFKGVRDRPAVSTMIGVPGPNKWDELFDILLDDLDYEAEPDASIDPLDKRLF